MPQRVRTLVRVASGRHPNELRCQNPDCVAVLDVTSIPVDAVDVILPRIFKSHDAAGALPSPLSPAVLDLFRECERQGDSVSFAVLMAELSAGVLDGGGGRELLPCGWPYCDGCYVALKASQQALHKDACARRDVVQAYLDRLEGGSGSSASASSAAAAAPPPQLLAALAEEEAALLAAVAAAEAACARAQARAARVRSRRAALASLHGGLWATRSEVSRRLIAGRETMDALGVQCARYREALGRLRCLRVQSDAFFIWHSEPFATINGARLGRVPGRVPDWAEINAALGQMALLLSLTAARLNFVFKKWRIIPMGSYSKIALVEDERASRQELSYDTSAFFPQARLSNALKPLMMCMAELGAHVEGLDRDKHGGQAHEFLPHPISPGGERVGDLAVALGKDVPWTRAMRMAATNLKWLCAYAEKQG